MYPDLEILDSASYLFYSLRFDLKTLTIWYSPLFIVLFVGLFYKAKWWNNLSKVIFSILFLFALVFGLVAVFYFEISKTIVGVELFQLVQGQSITVVLGYVLEFWWAILLSLLAMWGVLKIEKRTTTRMGIKQSLGFSLLLLCGIVFFARGGIALKPLNLLDAYGALTNEEATSAVTPLYVLLESIGKKNITYEEYISEKELTEELNQDKLSLRPVMPGKPNICLILLESFGKEYTGLNMSGRTSYTPFLDSLMNVSVNYTNAYANGLRSMDAVASIYCGVPSFMKRPFIGSLYTNSTIESLPLALKKEGYHTSFFHGADELSMGFKPFLLSQGLDQYYGKQQYPAEAHYDGTWGIFDEPYLKYFSDKLGEQPQPWFSSIFTLSSHHPYKVPKEYLSLPKGTAEIHQSVGYTDAALRSFFKEAKTQPWFVNTIFIITADHSSINETRAYSNYRGKYAIPLFIYNPKMSPQVETSVVQQIDIFPTVKSIAGVKSSVSMGLPLYDTADRYSFQYDGNVYVCTSDSFCLVWSGNPNPALFAYRNDPKHTKNISKQYPDETKRMLHRLKVFRQKYNYRLLNNDFK